MPLLPKGWVMTHRATIAPITSRLPATEAGIARRLRRLQAEM